MVLRMPWGYVRRMKLTTTAQLTVPFIHEAALVCATNLPPRASRIRRVDQSRARLHEPSRFLKTPQNQVHARFRSRPAPPRANPATNGWREKSSESFRNFFGFVKISPVSPKSTGRCHAPIDSVNPRTRLHRSPKSAALPSSPWHHCLCIHCPNQYALIGARDETEKLTCEVVRNSMPDLTRHYP